MIVTRGFGLNTNPGAHQGVIPTFGFGLNLADSATVDDEDFGSEVWLRRKRRRARDEEDMRRIRQAFNQMIADTFDLDD